mgnify:CR=1 FL=1
MFVRRRREEEVRERMMSGKRKRLGLEEKIQAVQHFAKVRDQY